MVEIGADRGGGLYAWTMLGAETIGVSLPGGQEIAVIPPGARMIWQDSREPATREALAAELRGRRPGLVFIDGDHDGASVASDWELALHLGPRLVVFHDIAGPHTPGVRPVYDLACKGRRHAELVEPIPEAEGTGVIWL